MRPGGGHWRVVLAGDIRAAAVGWAVSSASVAEIDELNILHATMLAMRRAIEQVVATLPEPPGGILIDGNRCPELPPALAGLAEPLVGGDGLSLAIGAASILAKEDRDGHMRELDGKYPAYGFAAHKGYPTAAHVAALRSFGVTPEHRMSFRPVREAAALRRTVASGVSG